VNKSNLTIVAADSKNTIIQGEENATVVRICSSKNISFKVFIIRGTGYTYPQPLQLMVQVFPWRIGILVDDSADVRLENNTIIQNLYGARLYNSKNVIMRSNHIHDNVYNFGVEGYVLSDYLHDIDT
jgi:parallel beta-helix repeat protein